MAGQEDAFLNSLKRWQLTNGQPVGSAHDDFVESAKHFGATPHDSMVDHAQREVSSPYSLEPRTTNYVPPLKQRTPEQLQTLPAQPKTHDDPWTFLKNDVSRIWHDPNKGFVHKLWDMDSVPGHLVAHTIATATHQPDAADYDLKTQTSEAIQKGIGWDWDRHSPLADFAVGSLADTAGMAASIAASPLTWVGGFGPEKKAAEALEALRADLSGPGRALEAGVEKNPMQVLAPHTREGIELNKQTIPRAAQLLTQKTVGAAHAAKEAEASKLVEEAANPQAKTAAQANLDAVNQANLNLHAASDAATDPATKTAWENALAAERKNVKRTPWGVSHPDIPETARGAQWENFHGPAVTDPMKNLAAHQALTEAEIEHGMPHVRIAGARTPIPTSAPWLTNAIKGVTGKWNPNSSLAQPAVAVQQSMNAVTPGSGDAFMNGVKTLFRDRNLKGWTQANYDTVTMGDVYKELQRHQVGASFEDEFKQHLPAGVLYGQPLKRWAEAEAGHFGTEAERYAALQGYRDVYPGLSHLVDQNVKPGGATRLLKMFLPSDPSNLRAGVGHLDELLGSKETKAYFDDLSMAPRKTPWRQRSKDAFTNGMARIDAILGHSKNHLEAKQAAINAGDNGALIAMMHEHHKALKELNSEHVQEMFNNAISAYHEMVNTHAPADVVAEHLKDMMDWQKTGRQTASTAGEVQQLLKGYVENQFGSGVHLLGKLEDPTLNGLMKDFAARSTQLHPGANPAAVQKEIDDTAQTLGKTGPQLIQEIRDEITKQAALLTQKGEMTAEQQARVLNTIRQKVGMAAGGTTDVDVYHLGHVLQELNHLRSKGQDAVHNLHQYGLEGIADHLKSLKANSEGVLQRMQLPFEHSLPYQQWVHEPNKVGKWYAKHLEPMANSVLRYSGWPQALIEAGNEYEGSYHGANRTADKMAMQAIEHDVGGVAKTHGLKWSIPNRSEADKAVAAMWGNERGIVSPQTRQVYENSLKQGGLTIVEKSKLERLLAIDVKARELSDAGRTKLQALLGPNGDVDQFVTDVKKVIKDKHMDPLLLKGLAAGEKVGIMRDYLPQMLKGKTEEKQRFWTVLNSLKDGKPLNSWAGRDALARLVSDGPVMSSVAAYERTRGFQSEAELEHALQSINKAMQEVGQPAFDLKVNGSLAGRIANRYQQQILNDANRRFITQLSTHLPSKVVGWLPPPTKGGSISAAGVKRQAERMGYKDVGDIIPALKGWHVNPKLNDWIRDVAGYETPPTGSAAVLHQFTQPLIKIQRYFKHLNTTFSGVHIKNAAANGLIFGGPEVMRDAAKMIGDATKAAKSSGDPIRWFSPMAPIAKALEKLPEYEEGLRHGLFRSGHEYAMPLDDLIDMRMNPHTVKQGLLNWANGRGPGETVTFDVVDRAIRMAMMKKYKAMGFTPARAAELANQKLVDYSMRSFTNGSRRLAQSMMQFPSWVIGNAQNHLPNMVQNPFWYALLGHASDLISNEHGGHTSKDLPTALAGAFAMGHTEPGTNNQVWWAPHFPYQSVQNMVRNTIDEAAKGHPIAAAYQPAHWLASTLVPALTVPGRLMDARGGTKGLEKESLVKAFLGDPKKHPSDSGVIGQALWGLAPYKIPEWIRALIDPSQWKNVPLRTEQLRLPIPGADVRGWTESIFGTPMEVKRGEKPVY